MLKNKKVNYIINSIKNSLKQKNREEISLHEPFFDKSETNQINECIKNRSVSTAGFYTKKFEEKIKKITKAKYAIATINATSAIHLALVALKVKSNDEVLLPALNFVASANACLYVGAVPHFVDVEYETLGIDGKKLEQYLSQRTIFKNGYCYNKKTKRPIRAIICMHTFGHPNNLDLIKKITKKYKLFLIEDAAAALGSYYKKRHVGTFGGIGIISFNGNKIITTGGGGVSITNKKKYAKRLQLLASIQKKPHPWKYEYKQLGYNFKMPSLNASLGLAQLKKLNYYLKAKRKIYKNYNKCFKNNKYFFLFSEPKNCKSNYWLQTIIINKDLKNKRDIIATFANKKGLKIRPVWKPLNKLSYLNNFPKMNLSVSNDLEKRIINLPSSASLANKI